MFFFQFSGLRSSSTFAHHAIRGCLWVSLRHSCYERRLNETATANNLGPHTTLHLAMIQVLAKYNSQVFTDSNTQLFRTEAVQTLRIMGIKIPPITLHLSIQHISIDDPLSTDTEP